MSYAKTAKEVIRRNPEVFEALLEFERTKRMPRLKRKVRANFTIDSDLLREFRHKAEAKGRKMSAIVEEKISEAVKEL